MIPIVPLRLSRTSLNVSHGFYEETRTSLYFFQMSRNDRSQPITNRVIYREGDVDVIEEDLKEIYPIFKWANHLETIWVILLLLQKAQLDGEATRAVMDYLVSSIENVQTRDALLQLSRSLHWGS